MTRDVPAIKELLRSIESLTSEAKTLANGGTSLFEQIRWADAIMHFELLVESLQWVVKNTESAIVSEAAEARRIEEVTEFWRQSDAKYLARKKAGS